MAAWRSHGKKKLARYQLVNNREEKMKICTNVATEDAICQKKEGKVEYCTTVATQPRPPTPVCCFAVPHILFLFYFLRFCLCAHHTSPLFTQPHPSVPHLTSICTEDAPIVQQNELDQVIRSCSLVGVLFSRFVRGHVLYLFLFLSPSLSLSLGKVANHRSAVHLTTNSFLVLKICAQNTHLSSTFYSPSNLPRIHRYPVRCCMAA